MSERTALGRVDYESIRATELASVLVGFLKEYADVPQEAHEASVQEALRRWREAQIKAAQPILAARINRLREALQRACDRIQHVLDVDDQEKTNGAN